MKTTPTIWFPDLKATIASARNITISQERLEVLQPLIQYVQHKWTQGDPITLNFICTHNSRRSQFSQIWAQTAALFYGITAKCISGGVEITAFNERAVSSLQRSGFILRSTQSENPKYQVFYSESEEPIMAFSKLFDDPTNCFEQFAAVMTCSHADENCPVIPGSEKRIALHYEDPKAFDDTYEEAAQYDETSLQIASEMFHVFSEIKVHL
jgi:arsenate reductase (thioredoxin)